MTSDKGRALDRFIEGQKALQEGTESDRHLIPIVKDKGIVPTGVGTSGVLNVSIELGGGKRALVPIWFRRPIPASVRHTLHQDFIGNDIALAEALKYVDSLEKKRREVLKPEDTISQAQALVRSSHAVAELHKRDVFAELRTAYGLDKAEGQYFERLINQADLNRGLAMINEAITKKYPDRLLRAGLTNISSMRELNQVLPDITAYEVMAISLLRRVPNIVINPPEGSVVMLLDIFIDGVVFVPDNQFNSYVASFEYLGISAKREGWEFVPFRSPISNLIRKLLALRLQDALLFERVFELHENVALRRGSELLSKYPINVRSELQNLAGGKILNEQDIVTLIGLLAYVPKVLRNKHEPFIGYIVPYGAGVKFVNLQGDTVEYVAFDEFVQGTAYEEITVLTSENLSLGNPLMSTVTQDLRRAIEGRLIERLGELSLIEELVADGVARFGIRLPDGSRKMTVFLTDVGLRVEKPIEEGDIVVSLKLSYKELSEIMNILNLIPPHIIRGICPNFLHRFLKQHGSLIAIPNVRERGLIYGSYFKPDKSITLYDYQAEGETFSKMSPIRMQIYRNSVIHEIGEAVWEALPGETKQGWRDISGWDRDVETAPFGYEGIHSVPEPEFRVAVESTSQRPIARKYEFLYKILGQEYSELSQYSIRDMQGEIGDLRIQQISLQEALRLQTSRRERLEDLNRQYAEESGMVISIEELRDRELAREGRKRPNIWTMLKRSRRLHRQAL